MKSKSFPHNNAVKVGSKSHKFGGHSVGHVKGVAKSGAGGKRIVTSIGTFNPGSTMPAGNVKC